MSNQRSYSGIGVLPPPERETLTSRRVRGRTLPFNRRRSHNREAVSATVGARRAAWSLALVAFVLAGVDIALLIAGQVGLRSLNAANTLDLVGVVGWGVMGAIVASRQPSNPIGWLFLAIAVVAGLDADSYAYAIGGLSGALSLPGIQWAAWVRDWVSNLIFPSGLLLFVFLLFPYGRLPSPRWRWLAIAAGVWTGVGATLSMIDPQSVGNRGVLPFVSNPIAVHALGGAWEGWLGATFILGGVALLLAAVTAAVLRLRRAKGDERQQMKWFALAGGISVVALAGELVWRGVTSLLFNGDVFILTLTAGFGIAVPVACGIAVLRYRLYDIDIVINKTVVYGSLAAFITAAYVTIVVGIGTAIGSHGSVFLSIVATAIVAVSFQPVRERARHLANRIVYGERATPYAVLSEFAGRMAETISIEEILPRMAKIVAEGTGAPRADVWVRVGGELRPGASWPDDATPPGAVTVSGHDLPKFAGMGRAVAVRHHGELLGAISVTTQAADRLSTAEDALLSDLARQAGLVLRNVRLIEELRASRKRLVKAQDDERRRIERNIHDGAQQHLVAMSVKLRLAYAFVGRDSAKAHQLLDELTTETGDTLDTLRDLARGIYPPLLADQGLTAALSAQARKSPIPVKVSADGLGRYPQEAEGAVYFSCLEGLQNVAKYAGATHVTICLANSGGELTFEVVDDGRGFDPRQSSCGTGLQGIADRLAALDGTFEVRSSLGAGTSLRGRVPLRAMPRRSEELR
jgi:signal transduction histidine kinase